jgi:hypothetical protein
MTPNPNPIHIHRFSIHIYEESEPVIPFLINIRSSFVPTQRGKEKEKEKESSTVVPAPSIVRIRRLLLHIFPQLDLTVKWSLYHARMSFHRHELGMSWPSDILGILMK